MLVIDEHSTYDLPNGRTSSHPFRCLALADGMLAASTTHAEGHIQVWDTRRWVRTQLLHAVEAESGERARFVKHAARATTSCLALDGDTLVAGSREGCVNSWRRAGGADDGSGGGTGGGRAAFARRCRHLRADQGPVAAVLLLPGGRVSGGRLLGVYQAARGTVDGDSFSGEQSVAAWTEEGQLLWRIAQPQPPQQPQQPQQPRSPPVIGAALGGGGLVVLLGSAGADAEWNLVLPPEHLPQAESSPPLLRIAPLPPASSGGGKPPGWRQLRSDAVVGGTAGRALAWHAEDGWVGVGFACGAVCLLPPSAEAGAARGGGAPEAVHGAPCAHSGYGADVGAVLVMPAARALGGGGGGESGGGACLLSGCAAGLVRVWLPGGAGKLAMVARVPLSAGAAAPRLQPCALAATRHHLLCGSAQGEIVPLRLPLAALAVAPAAAGGGAAGGAMGGAAGGAAGGVAGGAAGGAAIEYEWCFDAGSGPVARGAVRACRRPFDGWSKSAAYEAGLAAMLDRMAQNSGESHPGGGGGGGGGVGGGGRGGGGGEYVGGASAGAGVSVRVGGGAAGCRSVSPAASTPTPHRNAHPAAPSCRLARGVRVRLCGLVARAELNGCIGEVVGAPEPGNSGRIPVRIILPAEFTGQGVKLKPDNVQAE